MRLAEQPDGRQMIVDAVHGIDNLKVQLAAEEAAAAEARAEAERRAAHVEKTKAQIRAAEERLDAIVSLGTCAIYGCTHEHHQHITQAGTHANGVTGAACHAAPQPLLPRKRRIALEEKGVGIVWRIAFMLWNDETLDYASTAKAIWGDIPKQTAKNRISSNLAFLKNAGVIEETLGKNRFRINGAKLAAKSGIPVEEATP